MTDETGKNGAEKAPTPVRLGRVDSLSRCRRAVARITRAILAGEVSVKRGRAAIYGMREIRSCLVAEILEIGQRELEVKAGLREPGIVSGGAHQELAGLRKRRSLQ